MRFLGFLRRRQDPAKDSAPEDLPRKIFPSGIKLLYSPDVSTFDIVFIHGLEGDRETTWTAKDATDPWPKALLPNKFPARILTFGYDACVANSRDVTLKKPIAEHARDLLESLSSSRKDEVGTTVRPIIFVCHRFGGLLCKDALDTSRLSHSFDISRYTRGVIFIDPPNHESEHASLPDMDNINGAGEQPPIKVAYFYEKPLELEVDTSVPKKSAFSSSHASSRLHSKQIDMSKFTNVDDPGFMAFCQELDQWMRGKSENKRGQRNISANRSPTVNQHGHYSRQINLFGNGMQIVTEGHHFEAKGDQNFFSMPPKNMPYQPPPPYTKSNF